MKTLKINNRPIEFDEEKSLLEVIGKAGIKLPTFCYQSELTNYGACRMCVVEDDKGKIYASCTEPPREGMSIFTSTPRILKQRRNTLELLLANHDRDCTVCPKNGNCRLREVSEQLGVTNIRFGDGCSEKKPVRCESPSIVYDPNKCILCGDCVRTCDELQGLGILSFVHRGSKAEVSTAFDRPLPEVGCVGCGQCAAHCPTGALYVKDNTNEVWEALYDQKKEVIVQVAPAVRVAFGEAFGLQAGELTTGKIVATLKALGFAQVYDTSFTADLTIMEETNELVERIQSGGTLPLFTSCCPAWVKAVEEHHPEFTKNLSTCKSPMQMFSALLKKHAKIPEGKTPFNVAIMPCTAKKGEAKRPELGKDGVPDTDVVITTQELIAMVKEAGIDFSKLEDMPFDMPFGFATGSGHIFAASGGVMEAVLRMLDRETPVFTAIRGINGVKETTIDAFGKTYKIAVANGLKNGIDILEKMKKGEVHYDAMEVMACNFGCVAGAGQPINSRNQRMKRLDGVYRIDKLSQLSRSDENPIIRQVYDNYIGKPGSEAAHELLHTHFSPKVK